MLTFLLLVVVVLLVVMVGQQRMLIAYARAAEVRDLARLQRAQAAQERRRERRQQDREGRRTHDADGIWRLRKRRGRPLTWRLTTKPEEETPTPTLQAPADDEASA
jgi:hypothetical protein